MHLDYRAEALGVLAVLLCFVFLIPPACSTKDTGGAHGAAEVLASEEVIEGLRSPLKTLSKSVLNLHFPDPQSRGLFASMVTVVDLNDSPSLRWRETPDLAIRDSLWPIAAKRRTAAVKEVSLWGGFLDTVDFFHHFSFYNIRGSFLNTEKSKYRTRTGFKGLAQLDSGKLQSIKGELDVTWDRTGKESDQDETAWIITELATESFHLVETDRPLFTDVVEAALSPSDRSALLHSRRDEQLIAWILAINGGELTVEEAVAEYTEALQDGTYPFAINQVGVVDLDRDGFDDFYFTSFADTAMFFRNRGDGTFEEIAGEIGLKLTGVHSAFFADIDNDGDSDAFVSFFNDDRGTQYLRNENGRFVERNSLIEGALPGWVLPISAADYDNDGLLDVYLGGYSGQYVGAMVAARDAARGNGRPIEEPIPWLGERQSNELLARLRSHEAHPISNRPGAPNVLLKNLGDGRFSRAPDSEAVEIYYNTLATAWSDFDRDGDMDLYVTNEAGPNQLMLNKGDGTFVDISTQVTGEVGFGMGSAWGDYDNDGRQDMYTTNMYSKAGVRIAALMGSSEKIVQSARGNTLMRNGPDGFAKVSGLTEPAALVEAADFGWGGAFADLDNDTHLDLYVPAGYVSMPRQVATVGDS